jgi:hypothetical protein
MNHCTFRHSQIPCNNAEVKQKRFGGMFFQKISTELLNQSKRTQKDKVFCPKGRSLKFTSLSERGLKDRRKEKVRQKQNEGKEVFFILFVSVQKQTKQKNFKPLHAIYLTQSVFVLLFPQIVLLH